MSKGNSLFAFLGKELVQAGAKARMPSVTGSSWMKHVSRVYTSLSPAEFAELKRRAQKDAKREVERAKKPAFVLPFKVQCYAEAMGLPLDRAVFMYSNMHYAGRFTTPLYTIAKRLKISVPPQKVVKRKYHEIMKVRRTETEAAEVVTKHAYDRTALPPKTIAKLAAQQRSMIALANATKAGATGELRADTAKAAKAALRAPHFPCRPLKKDSSAYYQNLANIEKEYVTNVAKVAKASATYHKASKRSYRKIREALWNAKGAAKREAIEAAKVPIASSGLKPLREAILTVRARALRLSRAAKAIKVTKQMEQLAASAAKKEKKAVAPASKGKKQARV